MKISGIRPVSVWDRLGNLLKVMGGPVSVEQKIVNNVKQVPHDNAGKILDKLA